MNKKIFALLAIFSVMVLSSCGRNVKIFSGTFDMILKKMTLEEKAMLVTGAAAFSPADTLLEGQAAGAAGATTPIERINLPAISFADGPAGLRLDSEHTWYPCGTMLACSWDTELVENVASRIAEEARSKGVDVMLGPGMNIQRNPLGGRNFEYFSEDPYLTGKMAAAYVNGLQDKGVGACVKHFALNNQESGRSFNNARVSPRALREIYLKGFEMVVRESRPWAVMSSTNRINGVYASQSEALLTNLLRAEWGFDGVVVSGWGAADSIAAMLHAGNDLIEPGSRQAYEDIIGAVESGRLSEAELNVNARRVIDLLGRCSLKFEDAPMQHSIEEHIALARRCAADGMVLLENKDRFLPITAEKYPYVAVFGQDTLIAGGLGSSTVNTSHIPVLSEALANAGFHIAENAEDADVAFVVISRGATEGEDRPLSDFYLSKDENKMLNDVCRSFHEQNKKVAVILNTGGVIETASWKNLPDALLLAWLPGQEGGNAIADIVTGAVTPSGHLAQSFPIDCKDVASSSNFPMSELKSAKGKQVKNFDYTNYQEGIYVGYRYFDTFKKEVSYPFGYGLTYTTFSMDDPELFEYRFKNLMEVVVEVTNTGDMPGRAVVQLYVKAPMRGMQEKPAKELRAFAKTKELKPGETEIVTFPLTKTEFASYNEASCSWIVDSGTYIFMSGNSSADITGETARYFEKSISIPVEDVLALDSPINELRVRKSFFREHVRKDKSTSTKRTTNQVSKSVTPDTTAIVPAAVLNQR